MIYGITHNGKTCEFLTQSKFLRDLYLELLPDYRTRKQPFLSDSTFRQAKFMLKHAWKLELYSNIEDFVEEQDFTVIRKFNLIRKYRGGYTLCLIEENPDIVQVKSEGVEIERNSPYRDMPYILSSYYTLEIRYPATKECHEAVQYKLDKLISDIAFYDTLGLNGEESINAAHAELEVFTI